MTTLRQQRKDATDQYPIAKREEWPSKELPNITRIDSSLPFSEEDVGRLLDTVTQETGAHNPKDIRVVLITSRANSSGRPVDGTQAHGVVGATLQGFSHEHGTMTLSPLLPTL